MIKNGGDGYDSLVLREYLNKILKFSTKYDWPEFNEFIERNFDEDFWSNLESLDDSPYSS